MNSTEYNINIETHRKLARYFHINFDKDKDELVLPIKCIDKVKCKVYVKRLEPVFHTRLNGDKVLEKGFRIYMKIESKNISLYDEESKDRFEELDEFPLDYFQAILYVRGDDQELDKDDYMNAVQKLYETLRKLKFSKLNGCFQIKEDDEEEDDVLILEELLNHSNIESTFDVCCVCTSKTFTKTDCGHPLCFVCWEQIKIKYVDNDKTMDCPICRKNICLKCA